MAKREREESPKIRIDPNVVVEDPPTYEELIDQHQKQLKAMEAKSMADMKAYEAKCQVTLTAVAKERDTALERLKWSGDRENELKTRVDHFDKEKAELEDQYLKSLEEVQDSKHSKHRWMAWAFLWGLLVPAWLTSGVIGTILPLWLVYRGKHPYWLGLSAFSFVVMVVLFQFLDRTMNHKHEIVLGKRERSWKD